MKKNLQVCIESQDLRKKDNGNVVKCNVCALPFRAHGKYDRFCAPCRNKSKLLHFAEWLPEHSVLA